MRPFPIASQSDGINRLRMKGGATPNGLYDLLNGYVSDKGTLNSRPGVRKTKTFPAGTIEVVGFEGKFHTFAAVPVASIDPDIVVNVLRHPTGGAATLLTIHLAQPYLGKLYVIAEFTDNVVQHYWLDVTTVWAANTSKPLGSRVVPTASNGYYYANNTQNVATPLWTANSTVVVGDFRQPTTNNDLKYEATATTGTAPIRTSNTEPEWPTTVGATVVERRYVTESQTDPGSSTPPTQDPSDPVHGTPDDPFAPYPPGPGRRGLEFPE